MLAAFGGYRLPAQTSGATNSAGNALQRRPLPVITAITEAKDFPVYRAGLGTVQAYNTVTVKVRVDGEIRKIAFREGQDVRIGDLLAQIDPRPAKRFCARRKPTRRVTRPYLPMQSSIWSGSARWLRKILPRVRA